MEFLDSLGMIRKVVKSLIKDYVNTEQLHAICTRLYGVVRVQMYIHTEYISV